MSEDKDKINLPADEESKPDDRSEDLDNKGEHREELKPEKADNDKDNKDKKDKDNKKDDEYEEVCFMCRRPESKAGKMF